MALIEVASSKPQDSDVLSIEADETIEPDTEYVVSTGLEALDAFLDGGLTLGTTNLVITDGNEEGELLLMHMASVEPTTVIVCDRSEGNLRRAWGRYISLNEIAFTDRPEDAMLEDRVIIENFSAVCQDQGYAKALLALKHTMDTALACGRTVILHCVRGMQTDAQLARIRALADGVLDMRAGEKPTLTIPKLRGLHEALQHITVHKTPEGLGIQHVRRVV